MNNKRLAALDEILGIWYEKLNAFEEELGIDASLNSKIELQQRIKREIRPAILKYETEYEKILAENMEEASLISESEAETALISIENAVTSIENASYQSNFDGLHESLIEIREILNQPGQTAEAKLIVALSIVPQIISCELEMNTEFMIQTWQRVKSLLTKKIF